MEGAEEAEVRALTLEHPPETPRRMYRALRVRELLPKAIACAQVDRELVEACAWAPSKGRPREELLGSRPAFSIAPSLTREVCR